MGASKDLFFAITLLIALGVVWVFTGGADNLSARNPFINPLPPLGSGETYSNFGIKISVPVFDFNNFLDTRDPSLKEDGGDLPELATLGEISGFKGQISFRRSSSGAQENRADEEYVRIEANSRNKSSIDITGWKLSSPVSKTTYIIPKAAELPRSGVINRETEIKLRPKDVAIISTGRSPTGISFRTNICTGYFEQFKDFNPPLDKSCPLADNEFDAVSIFDPEFDATCVEFLEDITRCEMPLSDFPIGLTNSCRSFISEKINYTGCIENHQSDVDFYKNEWRLYLGKTNPIWKDKREIIMLLDSENKIVDTLTY